MSDPSPNLKCLVCKKELVEKQTKYCDSSCSHLAMMQRRRHRAAEKGKDPLKVGPPSDRYWC